MNTLKMSILSTALIAVLLFTGIHAEAAVKNKNLDVSFNARGITFNPNVQCRELSVTISRPNGEAFTRTFSNGGQGFVSLSQ